MRRRVKLGQHYLSDRDVLAEIIKCAEIKKGERVVEVGPGKGVLTSELLKKGAEVMAVEIDKELVEILKKELGGDNKNLKIINQDILDFIPISHLAPSDKLIGNIPYQITSPLLRKIFKLNNPPKLIILMVQKEVAERICAKPGDSRRGFLSVVVQYYARPEIVRIVSKESFYPVPKVESAILRVEIPNPKSLCRGQIPLRGKIPNLSRPPVSAEVSDGRSWTDKSKIQNSKSTKRLFRLVQAGFSQKRKKLRNSLAGGLQIEPKKMDKLLQKAGIDSNLRAEDLGIEDWLVLVKKIGER